MPTLNLRGFLYALPVKATVTVVDSGFHAMGDLNWDGSIDGSDLEIMYAAYGSKPGDPHWNPDADLNGDGRVDMRDIGIVLRNVGLLAPTYVTPAKAEVLSGKVVVTGVYRASKLKKEFAAGSTVAFVFTALGLLGRVVIVPI